MNNIGLTMNMAANPVNLIGMGIEQRLGSEQHQAIAQRVGEANQATADRVKNEVASVAKKAAASMDKVGKDFEGVFLSMMLKEMRNTLEEGGFFGEESSDTYGGMFDMFIGQSMAETKPLGIANILVDNYAKNQQAADALASAPKLP